MTSGLDAAGVGWTRAENLVRGLDYYRHTAFEFIPDEGSAAADLLGAQSTVLGGGRYDGLMESWAARRRLRSAGLRGSSGWRCWWGSGRPDVPEVVVVVRRRRRSAAASQR